MHNRY